MSSSLLRPQGLLVFFFFLHWEFLRLFCSSSWTNQKFWLWSWSPERERERERSFLPFLQLFKPSQSAKNRGVIMTLHIKTATGKVSIAVATQPVCLGQTRRWCRLLSPVTLVSGLPKWNKSNLQALQNSAACVLTRSRRQEYIPLSDPSSGSLSQDQDL